jgi:LysM repeat protein
VKKNETLGSIAHAYGLKTSDLAVANSISDPKKIRPGQELIIPAGGHASKSGKASTTAAPAEAPAAHAPAESPPPAPPALPPPSPAPDSGTGAPSGPGADVPVIKIESATAPSQPAPAK